MVEKRRFVEAIILVKVRELEEVVMMVEGGEGMVVNLLKNLLVVIKPFFPCFVTFSFM